MPFDPATVVALAAACAPAVAPQTLLAIAEVESGRDPLAIGVNGSRVPRPAPRDSDEATRIAERLIAKGRDIDLGLAQINIRNLPWLGLTVAEAFDPCRNLEASARVLAEGYRRALAAPGGEQQALRTALSYYNTGHPRRGLANGYVARVTAAAARLSGPSHAAADAFLPSAAPPAWDVFARTRRTDVRFVVSPNPGVSQ